MISTNNTQLLYLRVTMLSDVTDHTGLQLQPKCYDTPKSCCFLPSIAQHTTVAIQCCTTDIRLETLGQSPMLPIHN